MFGIFKRVERLEKEMAATQAEIDALTAELTEVKSNIDTNFAALQTEIANLKSAGVDITALQAAADALKGDSAAVAPPPVV